MDDTNTSFLEGLQNLKKQGQMSRFTAPKCALVWATVVQSLPEEKMKFALNAGYHTMPTYISGRKGKTPIACSASQTYMC